MGVKYRLPFKAHDGVDWWIDIGSDAYVNTPPATLTYSLEEQLSSYFIDGRVQILINGEIVDTLNSADTKTMELKAGAAYSFKAFSLGTVVDPAFLNLTVIKSTVVIYQDTVEVTGTADDGGRTLIKTGIVQPSANYQVIVSTHGPVIDA